VHIIKVYLPLDPSMDYFSIDAQLEIIEAPKPREELIALIL
jgi:hypothetical protein